MVLGKKVAIFDWEWGRNSAPSEGQKIPLLVIPLSCLTASRLVASILRVVSCFLLRSISPSSRLNIVILSMNFVG